MRRELVEAAREPPGALIAGTEKDLPGVDIANVAQLAQSLHLTSAQPRERASSLGGLRDRCSDRLAIADHGYGAVSLAGTICAS
jgi:hypothetical protein